MKTNQQMKRLISLVLALMMLVGLLPVQAHAAAADQPVDAMVVFSDLHAMYNGDSSTGDNGYKQNKINKMMTALKNSGLPISSLHSGGDAFSSNGTSYTGYTDTITGYIRNTLGNVQVGYVWSDHDRGALDNSSSRKALDKTSHLAYGAGADGRYGTADDSNYYVYYLSMGDLCTYDRYSAGFNYTLSSNNRAKNGFTATVPEAIANFEADAALLRKDRPLFIVSHQPLFDNRNDNGWAEDWFDAINEVAEEMDVTFFYGHNHKYDSGSDYYYAKGSTMNVARRKLANGSDWNYAYQTGSGWQYDKDLGSVKKTLNFSHMCGGYFDPGTTGSTSNTTRAGTVVVATIYDDAIRYTTYNNSGIFKGSYALDVTVDRAFAAVEPELEVTGTETYFVGEALDLTVSYKVGSDVTDVTAIADVTGFDMDEAGDYTVTVQYEGLTAQFPIQVRQKLFLDASGVTVEVNVPGTTALNVDVLDAGDEVFGRAEAMVGSAMGYDVSLTGYAQGSGAIVTLPVPAGVTEPAVCFAADNGDLIKVECAVSGDAVSFETDVFGTYLVGQKGISEDLEQAVIAGGVAYEERTVYVRVDSFANGGKYLLIGENKPSNGDKIAYLNNSGSEGWEVVSINSGSITTDSGTYTKGYIELNNANAVWTASNASSGVTLSNNGRYIGGTDANTLRGSSGEAAKVTYDAGATRLKTASGTTYYLYYSTYGSENWKWSTSSSSSTSSRNMWIYKEETVRVPVSAPVTYTLEASDLHQVLSEKTAQLSFSLLADGETAELPAGGWFDFEVVNDLSGIVASISDAGLVTFNNVEGRCFVKISYTWSEGTAYKYVKLSTEADPNACDHSYTAQTLAPTCTEAGYTTYTCVCGDSYTETIPALGHDHKAVTTAPTCTEGGYTTYTCHCGDSYVSDRVSALGHKYASVVTKPTCTEAGFTTYTCACGDSYVADEVKALGHTYEAVTTEATCTENGSVVHTCHCGESYTDILPALGHDYKAVTTAPTCTEQGFTTYTCSCGESYVANEVPALGHTYESVTTEATCTTDGSIVHTCHCGESYTDILPALGHKYEAKVTAPTCTESGFTTYTCHCGESYVADEVPALGHSYESVVTAPTCTEAGFTTYTCACGDSYVADEVKALGHSYESVTTEATCTENGSIVHTCHCGDSYTEVIEALGHRYETVITAPTCTEAGFAVYTCHCGDAYVADEVPALGHAYRIATTEATCTEPGATVYTCDICGDSYTEVIEALGHSYDVVVTNPTCTEAGSTVYTCHCGDSYTEVIPALGHVHKAVVTKPTCTEAGFTTYVCHCGDRYVADETPALGHSHEAVTTEATCTFDGSVVYTCACGDSYSEIIPALGHAYEAVVTAPTCTEAGFTAYTCHCGDSYVADEIPALGHAYESVITAPTCTEIGFTTYTCHCGDVYVADEVAALGHAHEAVITAPTCTEAGFTTYTCHCGDVYVADETAALGHAYETVTVDATCTADGSVTTTCTVCGETTVEILPALGHTYQSVTTGATCTENGSIVHTCPCGETYTDVIPALGHSHEAVVTNPTCTEAGFTTYTCHCGDSYVADEVPALGHTYESVTTEATCTEAGSIVHTCPCGETYTDVIPALGHAYETKVTAPTCTENGFTTHTCHCGDSYITDETAPLGHDHKSVTTAPTCEQDGSIVYTCHCGDTYTEVIPALGHTYESKVTAPTCTEAGYTTYTCHCGDSYVADEVPALGHTYESKVTAPTCTASGYTTYTCHCGHSYIADQTPALGHDYDCVEQNGFLIYTCGHCGDSYSESVAWIAVGKHYVLDTNGIDVGKDHKYLVVGADRSYALTVSGNTVGSAAVTIRNNAITLDNASNYEFYFVSNSKESGSYLLTKDGKKTVYHEVGEMHYGNDSKGYWHFGSSSNGAYQIYDNDWGTWYLNYGYVWGNDSVSRFAVSSNARSVRLFKAADSFARLSGEGFQTYDHTANVSLDTILGKLTIQLSNDGNAVSQTLAVTADLVTWDKPFSGITAGTYTGTVRYQGVTLGSVQVTITGEHTYETVTTEATCTASGVTTHFCTGCGHSYQDNVVEALGHSYSTVESNGYFVHTCTRCGDSYSEKISEYTRVSALSAGKDHVITLYSGGNYYALSHANNSLSLVRINVSNEEITSEITNDLLWTYRDSKLSYVSNGTTYYLYSYSNSWWGGWWGSSATLQLSTGNSSTVSLSNNRLKVGNSYLRYNNGSVDLSSSATTAYVFLDN